MNRITLLLLLISGPLLMSCTTAPDSEGKVSNHFNGKHFVNTEPMDKSAGDTGYSPHLQATGDRHGPFALSLLPS